MDKKCIFAILFYILFIVLVQIVAGNESNIYEGAEDALSKINPPIVASLGQNDDTESNKNQEPTVAEKMNFSKEMSLYVLGFGVVLSIFTGIIALRTKGWNREATNIFTVTIIITAGLFLMTAGYSSEQIAPMYGLLGTIVGYLLGKTPPSVDRKTPPSGDVNK